MPINFIQSKDAYASSVAFDSSVVTGNCIVVVGSGSEEITACAKSAGTATIGTVQSITEYNGGSTSFIHYFYCFVTGNGTLTMALTGGGDVGITIHEVSGIDSLDAYESWAFKANPIGKDPAVGNGLTTTIPDSILFCYLNNEEANSGTITVGDVGGTWTLTGDQPTHQHACEYLILTGTVTNCLANFHTSGTQSGNSSGLQAVAFNGSVAGGVSIPVDERGMNRGMWRGENRGMSRIV